MKKLTIFFSSFLMATGLPAQNTTAKSKVSGNVCSVLSKILAEAPDQFKKLDHGEMQSLHAPLIKSPSWLGYKTMDFPGALISFITLGWQTPREYVAFFGIFKTLAKAKAKLNSIKAQVKRCLPGFKFTNRTINSAASPFGGYPVVFEFTGKNKGNTVLQVIELRIEGGDTSVYLVVKGLERDWGLLSKETEKKEPVTKAAQDSATLIDPIPKREVMFEKWGNREVILDTTSINKTEPNPRNNKIPAQEIKSVIIGTQTWMTENLNSSTFRNGDLIPEAKSEEDWIKAGKEKKAVWCYYENDPANGKKYGKLYNWYAVNDPRGLAPKGWHIPVPNEWLKLKNFLGEEEASAKMRSKSGWYGNGNGNNSSGFTAYPGGMRLEFGDFLEAELYGYWWSSTEDWAHVDIYYLCFCGGTLGTKEDLIDIPKDVGCSVRCIKD